MKARGAGAPATKVGFWFDYSSPYAYLASTQVAGLAARTGATVELRPILLGAMFKAIGTPMVPLFEMSPPKQRMMALELYRWADHWGVPFRFASPFPQNTIKACRATLACPAEHRRALIDGLFRAIWAEGRDISGDAEVAAVAEAAGWSGAEAVAAASSDAMRAALREATDAAIAAGVCGVPTFEVEGDLYWGQDRLELVEEKLAKG